MVEVTHAVPHIDLSFQEYLFTKTGQFLLAMKPQRQARDRKNSDRSDYKLRVPECLLKSQTKRFIAFFFCFKSYFQMTGLMNFWAKVFCHVLPKHITFHHKQFMRCE